ncbi:MAG: ATP-binding protein, partial [Patescibacteria group bacterium]
NQYLFFTYNTSPAVVLMPVGVGIAAVYLGGYRMWVPLACAWFIALLTSPAQPSMVFVVAAAAAYPLQAVVGGYILRRFNFLGTLGLTRCSLILIATALITPVIAPGITTIAQWLSGTLSTTAWTTWSRAWAGGVMSIMVFTPLITTWFRSYRQKKTLSELAESAAALSLLAVAVYFIFWTKLAQGNSFIFLYLLFSILFWIGLRLRPRMTPLALFLVAALGMAGTILVHPNAATPLNTALLSNELFIILIAPVFFILTSLVEERRVSAEVAQAHARELESANRRLSQEDKAKNDFLATLAHELRNPLAPVVSSLELIKIRARDLHLADIIELAEVADAHNHTLTRLLDDILDISRITRKKLKLQKETIELRRVVEPALRTVDALYKSKNHILSISIPKESARIEADPLRLEQILVNLLNNAAKYTPPGGYIELGAAYDKARGVRFSVKDNGIGLEPHMLDKVFEPYVQHREGSSGLGIGLSLTRRLVELHGGTIWAESEGPGKGTTFVVVLPPGRSAQLPLSQPARRRRNNFPFSRDKKPAQKHRILIVDDNQAAAEGLGASRNTPSGSGA